MKYNINIEDAPDHEIGLEIMRVLNLKGDKGTGRVQTTHGDKNPCGLARTVRHLSAGQLEKAAPDMLTALRDLFNDWVTLVGEDLREGNDDVKRIWDSCEAVLDKAEGRNP